DETFIGLVELMLRLNNQEEVVSGLRQQAVSHGTRQDQVVARLEIQGAEVGFDLAAATVNKEELVAIGVAVVERHRLRTPGHVKRDVVVAEKGGGHALGIVEVARLNAVKVEEVRPELAFETDPSGGRVRVVKVRALAVETFASVLLFVSAGGDAHM